MKRRGKRERREAPQIVCVEKPGCQHARFCRVNEFKINGHGFEIGQKKIGCCAGAYRTHSRYTTCYCVLRSHVRPPPHMKGWPSCLMWLPTPQELELMEDVWRGEAQDLLTQIAQLQEENKALVDNLSPKSLTITQEEILRQEAGMSERERQVMKKLKEVVDKQRDELRAKDRELTLKNQDVEALQQQLNRLMKINHDLRHKVTVMDAQGRALIEQKAELEALLQTREQETGKLRAEAGKSRDKSPRQPAHNQEEKGKAEALSEEDFLDSEPVVVDVNDTSRPRFTLQELRDVLHERNELKAKVFVLQEELAYYKSEEAEEENAPFSPPSPALQQKPAAQPESSIRRLIFTAIMPMVAAGLIPDDPTLQPIRRLVSLVGPFSFFYYLPINSMQLRGGLRGVGNVIHWLTVLVR
uniref:Rab interacting lysosomal protein like 1 n=1 Tax=Callorhinchus milii TaxID=7868 RepID=A0A4W3J6L7_CALMI